MNELISNLSNNLITQKNPFKKYRRSDWNFNNPTKNFTNIYLTYNKESQRQKANMLTMSMPPIKR